MLTDSHGMVRCLGVRMPVPTARGHAQRATLPEKCVSALITQARIVGTEASSKKTRSALDRERGVNLRLERAQPEPAAAKAELPPSLLHSELSRKDFCPGHDTNHVVDVSPVDKAQGALRGSLRSVREWTERATLTKVAAHRGHIAGPWLRRT